MRFRTLIWSIAIVLAAQDDSMEAGENWSLHEGQYTRAPVTTAS